MKYGRSDPGSTRAIGACLAAAAALLVVARPAAAEEPLGCVTCHKEEATDQGHGIHQRVGVTCITCHGGDPAGTTRDVCREGAPGFLGTPTGVRATELCGGCHSDLEKMHDHGLRSDQLALYKRSGHGKKLYGGEDADVATCVSCHGAHKVLAADDPRSPVYASNVPATCAACHDGDPDKPARTDVYTQYRGGVHGKRLLDDGLEGSPNCVTCHGSHGARPPGLGRVPSLCGKCHAQVQDYFERGPHAALTRDGDGCVACHGNHAIEPTSLDMLDPSRKTCLECHEGEEAPRQVALQVLGAIRDYEREYEETSALVAASKARGLLVTDQESFLRDAHRARAELMQLVHTLDARLVDEAVNRGRGLLGEIRRELEHKGNTFRDRKILASGFFLVTCAWSGLLLLRRRSLLASLPPQPGLASGGATPGSGGPPATNGAASSSPAPASDDGQGAGEPPAPGADA